jgi:integrase
MARKRKLDPYVSAFVDRHHKERFRFRRNGFSCYLPNPTSKDYRAAYEEATLKALGSIPITPRAKPGTVGDLMPRFYASVGFRQGSDEWKATRRRVLEGFREEFGDDPVAAFRPKDIDAIIAAKLTRKKVGRRWIGGSHAALRLREQLEIFFDFAVRQEWRSDNPVEKSETVKHKKVGFHEWTEEEIAQYRAYWPLGTKARLAMELILWTGKRRSDAHRAAPPKNGRIAFTAKKTGKDQDLPVAPQLQAAIDAMPTVGITTLLVTEYGKPFTVGGFGNKVREWCDDAGLPQCTAHGLRKALARRAADRHVSQQGLKALGQWSGDREVAVYVAGANQKALAESALVEVIEWERETNIG